MLLEPALRALSNAASERTVSHWAIQGITGGLFYLDAIGPAMATGGAGPMIVAGQAMAASTALAGILEWLQHRAHAAGVEDIYPDVEGRPS